MQSQTWDDAIPRNLIIFMGGLKLLVVTVYIYIPVGNTSGYTNTI